MAKLDRKRKVSAKPVLSQDQGESVEGPRRAVWAFIGIAIVVLAGCVAFFVIASIPSKPVAGGSDQAASAASYVGSEACAGCHQVEDGLWRTSQHKHAMDHATEKS